MSLKLSLQATSVSRYEVIHGCPYSVAGCGGAGPEGPMEAVEGPGHGQMGHLHGRIQSGSSDLQMEVVVDSPLTAAAGSGCLSCTDACGILLLFFLDV